MPAKKIATKVCTKSGKSYPATPEFFYRDKSQKDGLSPWSKDAERAYNKAYYAGLKAAKAPKVAAITTPKARKAFTSTMSGERVVRGTHTNRVRKASAPVKATPTRKATTTRKARTAKAKA